MKSKFQTIDEVGARYRFSTRLPIVGDKEGLLLTSYQSASEHTAARIMEKLGKVPVLELCCGVGGTTVFLAQELPYIYAVDLNPKRLAAARINARTFGVEEKITFVQGDSLDEDLLIRARKDGVQAVVTDVEWRDNLSKSLQETTANIADTIPSTPVLFEKLTRLVSPNMVMHLATNSNKDQLRAMADCEIEQLVYQGTVKFLNVYFGQLANLVGVSHFLMA